MTTKDEALKLEALEHIDYEDSDRDFLFPYQRAMLEKAITARVGHIALHHPPAAQPAPAQEPAESPDDWSDWKVTPPAAQRQWVGLTDVEWMNIVNKDQAWVGQRPDEVAHEVAKLVEAKLKEKNT
jgi:hypothetical protein